ncbi:MAG: metal-dependent hydrolase [Bacteroidota bacterium]
MLWGAVGGTIPDLDVIFNLTHSEVEALFLHRGFSHSFLFAFLVAPVLGYLISRLHYDSDTKWTGWGWLFFWSIITHPMLDIFTNYGTGIWIPFSENRVALNTIFVADPLYTTPLLLSFLIGLFLNRKNVWRARLNRGALALSVVYLGITVVNKIKVDDYVERQLSKQEIEYSSFITMPTPLNNILWSVVTKVEDGYLVGYYSLLDTGDLELNKLDQKAELLEDISTQHEVNQLIKFSKGYFAIREEKDNLVFNDLRFGPLKGWFDPSSDYVFGFDIKTENDQVTINRRTPTSNPTSADFQKIVDRIWGK